MSTWPDYVKPGCRVRATSKDGLFVHEFTVQGIDLDGELVARKANGGRQLLEVFRESFDVEVMPAPLPTAIGLYVAGTHPPGANIESLPLFRRMPSSEWYEIGLSGTHLTHADMEELAERFGGLTRLTASGATQ